MNIGLDIDNVITDFDAGVLKAFLIEDKNKRNKGIINKKAKRINQEMFDWTKEEVDEFYNKNMEQIAQYLKPRRNCKQYMDNLINDKHNLILITYRAYPHYLNPQETTINWLKKHKINYTKLVLSQDSDKTKECQEHNIDIMVDDRAKQCKKMRANGINCILMLTKYNKNDKENLPYATSWQNLYEIITNKTKK